MRNTVIQYQPNITILKIPAIVTFVLLQFVIITDGYSQLGAEAGNDTAVCADNSVTLTIGGNPTATGGLAPYRYTWLGTYHYAGSIYTASFMLEDTTVANPAFKEGAIPDSVLLYVIVMDAENNSFMDSIQIRQSRYTICLGECRHNIREGDSVQLGHCVIGGFPPMQLQWEPIESLSDGSVGNPWAKPISSTTYVLHITDSIGCQIESNCKVFVIPAGIDEKNQNQVLVVNFNPSEKILYVKILQAIVPNGTFELISLSGSTVFKANVEGDTLSINLQQLKQGLYIYYWSYGGKKIASGKILI